MKIMRYLLASVFLFSGLAWGGDSQTGGSVHVRLDSDPEFLEEQRLKGIVEGYNDPQKLDRCT